VTTWRRIRDYLTAGVVLSALLHFLVTGWGLFVFATGPLEASPQDIVPVDVISDDKLSQMMKGIKTGDKNETRPQADKIGDPKLPDNTLGKLDDKKPPIKAGADKDVPKPEDKPVEKKPDPKPVAQDKPKDEPTPAKQEPKIDQIAEKLQQDQPKDPPKPEPKQPPKPKKDYTFDPTKMSQKLAELDKRDATRQSITGTDVNPKPALGVETPAALTQKNTYGWIGALQKKISDCWSVPAGVRDADTMQVRILIRLSPNGMLQGHPELVEAPAGNPATGFAFAQSAIRAIEQCQPYNFLPKAEYKGGWDYMDMTFSPKDLFHR
jgi:outer membrane biosynthesis protein TonB